MKVKFTNLKKSDMKENDRENTGYLSAATERQDLKMVTGQVHYTARTMVSSEALE